MTDIDIIEILKMISNSYLLNIDIDNLYPQKNKNEYR